MENKNNWVKVGFSTILWSVMAILICAAPSLRADETVPAGETWEIDYLVAGSLLVNGTANLLPGADIEWFVYTIETSVLNIKGGTVGMWIDVAQGAKVTVYGTGFNLGEGEHFIDYGTVTGFYENDDPIDLTFDCQPGATVKLAAPGGESITVNIEKAKVCWDHSDIHVDGKLYLPQGVWMDNLNPVGSAVIKLAEVEVVDPEDQSVAFEIKGKDGKKWEYKDKENIDGPIKEFKIDWKGAKFDYKGDEGLHIHTHFIGGTETTLCIHCDHISGAFTVTINGITIEYDGNGDITGDIGGDDIDPQKDDNTHVHFTLPFQLSPDMTIEVSGAVVLTIPVANYYEEGFVKFKLISAFDTGSFSDGSASSPEKLEIKISLVEDPNTISGSDLIDAWTKKDDKHWDYK